jgi:nucleoside-diphosphate-sugar epimerase
MKIFLAGATGVIGKRLTPLLVRDGHQVFGTTKTPAKVDALRKEGVEPVALDVLNRDAVMKAVLAARPEVVIHQVTSIGTLGSLKHFDREFAATNRLRTEGTDNLLEAARAAGATQFVAQSYTSWPNARDGGRVKTEDDPLDAHPPRALAESLAAIQHLENSVTRGSNISSSVSSNISGQDMTGIVLRYGGFYGPGTSLSMDGSSAKMVREGKFPIVGSGTGVWSFIHIDDAATATVAAINRGVGGIFNIVDDEPAEVSVWLPVLAEALGAKPPRHLPTWLGRLFVGDAGISMMTQIRGSSNAKAKRLLNWQPKYASWREGFRQGL